MAVKKVFTPVGVTFRGDGFYKTDSRGQVVDAEVVDVRRRPSRVRPTSSRVELVDARRTSDELDERRRRSAESLDVGASPDDRRDLRRRAGSVAATDSP